MTVELNSRENELNSKVPVVSWEEFISKIKEYLASEGEKDPDNAFSWYEDYLKYTYDEGFSVNRIKNRQLDLPTLRSITIPILGGL